MNVAPDLRRSSHRRLSLLLLSTALLAIPTDVRAVCGLDGAVGEQLRLVKEISRETSLSFGSNYQLYNMV